MANEEQLSILKQGVEAWNRWRNLLENIDVGIDLRRAVLSQLDLTGANLREANLESADLRGASLLHVDLRRGRLSDADLSESYLIGADLHETDFTAANLRRADLGRAHLSGARISSRNLSGSLWVEATVGHTFIADSDLSQAMGLEIVHHLGPSSISSDTFALSKGKIPEVFLRGCGLSDWEVESVKLYRLDLSNEEINDIQYKTYDLRATQALQISPLFISYSHSDGSFVDKLESYLNNKGIRFWRDVHDLKSGRMETQIDRAMRLNPTVLLILSEHSLKSDWVEHEVRTARHLEKEMGRDVLCPVALDDSWKSSLWPKRLIEQITEYNILDFSAWRDGSKFDDMFRKLIDGLELFYKG